MALGPSSNKSSSNFMTGGEAIIRALIVNGVDTVFGLPGAQTYPLFDALERFADKITTFGVRHEQAAAYMALGYAKATGRPGVYTVVPGPGMLNTAAALSTAWATNAPVLCITGQIPSRFLGKRRGALHEIPDQLATLRGLTKWAARIERAEDAPDILREAFRVMLSGRPGPVAVEMSWDRLAEQGAAEIGARATPDAPPLPSINAIARAASLLAGAERPMILLGGGAQHASKDILELVERLGAPVAAFRSGRGIVAEDHPLSVSSYAASMLWAETDVLLGIGSRLEMPYARWADMMEAVTEAPDRPALIRIDIDPAEMTRLKPHVAIVADAAEGARAIVQALTSRPMLVRSRERIARTKEQAVRRIRVVKPHVEYLAAIRDALPRDGFFVEELCQAGFASYFAFPVYTPRTYVTPGFQGTLGFGFPTALGVKAAYPDRAVVSISGDGGFMFGVQDLATAVERNLGVVAIVFNNKSFGNVRRDLKRLYKGAALGAELRNPDFAKLAEAFGADFYRAVSPDDLKPKLADAIARNAPAIIEVLVDPDEEVSPWPFIHTNM
jgi:acetolactate synthase-1/2/3 large subunit